MTDTPDKTLATPSAELHAAELHAAELHAAELHAAELHSAELHATEETFAPGNILAGKYKIISILGTGGMGTVYRVQQVFLSKMLALKTLDSKQVSDVLIRRFQVEAKAASSLSHPNLIQVHDFGLLNDDEPYLVMDLVDGITLADMLKTQGPMPYQQLGPLFAQICFGLAYAHDQGVVHRDIKPSNIMIVNGLPMATEGSVKVVDFGIAKLINTDGGEIQALSRTGDIFGSPLYMSPEQCSGGEVDRRTDVYALGCVLFEALTGTPPHVGTNSLLTMMLHQSQPAPTLKEASLGKEFPAALEQIVERMLRKLPAERYQNLGLVAHDLAGACSGASLDFRPAKPTSAKPAPVVSISVNQIYFGLGLVLLLTVSIGGLVGYYFTHREATSVAAHKELDSNEVRFKSLPKVDLSERAKRNLATLKEAKPIKSTIVTKDGKKQRQFDFPACGIGSLKICDDNYPSAQIFAHAQGTVYAPPNLPLTLVVDEADYPGVLETPAIFENIDREEFCGLSLVSVFGMEPGEAEKKNLAQILRAAAKWPKLRTVELHSMAEDQAVFDALNTMKGLRNFVLEVPIGVSAADLARLPFLARLETLGLLYIEDINIAALMPNLTGSSSIKHLLLNNASVTAASLLNLSHCSNLSYLAIEDQMIDDKLVQSVTRLSSLRIVSFAAKLSEDQLKMLVQCAWLTEIRLSKQFYSRRSLKQLETLDRRIRFI